MRFLSILWVLPFTVAAPVETVRIALINRSALLGEAEFARMVAAVQVQVSRDFAPVWRTRASLVVWPAGKEPEPGMWTGEITDAIDRTLVAGYRTIGPNGLPHFKVFATVCRDLDIPISRVFSHEVLEMLANPRIVFRIAHRDANGADWMVPLEVCDPVMNLVYEIQGAEGAVVVSNFVLPAFYEPPTGPGGTYDFLGAVRTPMTPARNGLVMRRRLVFDAQWDYWWVY